MLELTKEKKYNSVKASMDLLKPVLESLNEKYKVDLESKLLDTLKEENSQKIIKVIYEILSWDVKELIDEAKKILERKPEKALMHLKMAYLDYTLVDGEIEKQDFKKSQGIKKLFREAISYMSKLDPYNESKEKINYEEFFESIKKLEEKTITAIKEKQSLRFGVIERMAYYMGRRNEKN